MVPSRRIIRPELDKYRGFIDALAIGNASGANNHQDGVAITRKKAGVMVPLAGPIQRSCPACSVGFIPS